MSGGAGAGGGRSAASPAAPIAQRSAADAPSASAAADSRLGQLRLLLEARGLDAALLKLPENLVLLSGYWPRNGFSFAFVHRSGAAALLLPEGDLEEARLGLFEDLRTFAWGRLADGDPWANAAAALESVRRDYELGETMKVGVDSNADAAAPGLCCGEALPPGRRALDLVREVLGCPAPTELMPDLAALRAAKLPGEIERIELANEIARAGVEAFERAVERGGAREIDLAAEAEAEVARRGCGHRGRVRSARGFAQVSSGAERTARGWLAGIASTDRVVRPGDFAMLELGVVADGYWADLTRTVVAGGPDREQAAALAALSEAQAAAISASRPGARAGEVYRAARDVLYARGFGPRFPHGLGHGTGIAYHDGGPFLVPGSDEIIREGMVHSVEPGIYVEGWGGIRQEVDVVVTPEGARALGAAGPA